LVHGKILEYDPKALYFLKGDMKIRYFIVWLISWK